MKTYGFIVYALFAMAMAGGFCWQMAKPVLSDVIAYVNNDSSPTPREKRKLYATMGCLGVFSLWVLLMYSIYLYQHR